jgi:hypothetical protein
MAMYNTYLLGLIRTLRLREDDFAYWTKKRSVFDSEHYAAGYQAIQSDIAALETAIRDVIEAEKGKS